VVDLHRHLDGSLRPQTVVELAAQRGFDVPERLVFEAGMGLDAALARFAFTLSLLDQLDSVSRVASEMCEDAVAEGLEYLEIRFAPQLHGPPIAAVVDAVVQGTAGRAGILLCGLYGEPPSVLGELVEVAASRPAVVGIDLAGAPLPFHDFGMIHYAPAFRRAAELGLGRTVHAGEGRPPAEIAMAIELLGAQRIGHGTTLLDDADVVELVLRRGITIEACPTSNVQTGVISWVSAHPIRTWLRLGIKVAVCTDNTMFSATTVPAELDALGLDAGQRQLVRDAGMAAAFRRGDRKPLDLRRHPGAL
jgi:adenosine deaminase